MFCPHPNPLPHAGEGARQAALITRRAGFAPSPPWGKAGMGARLRPRSNGVAPTPTLPQRGREQRPAARSSGLTRPGPSAAMARVGLQTPSGRAEKRRAWGGHRQRSMPMLRALTRCGCLNGALQARSEFRSAAPRTSIAGCPQRSAGTRPAGPPFLWLLSFGGAKESDCAAGRTSRPAAHPPPKTPNSIAPTARHTSAKPLFRLKPQTD